MKDLIERIKKVRRAHGLTQKQFADAIGYSQGNIGDWERGRSSPSAAAIQSIVNTFNVNSAWLLTGVEEGAKKEAAKNNIDFLFFRKLNEEDKKDVIKYAEYLAWKRSQEEEEKKRSFMATEGNGSYGYKQEDVVMLPLLGNTAAGVPIHIEELLEGYVPVKKRFVKGKCFLIRVKGDSMINAGIEDGDLVVVRAQPVVETGEIAVVRIDNEVTAKYFHYEEGKAVLRSANPKYRPIASTNGEISIIGKVVELIKKEEADKIFRPYVNDGN